MRFAPLALGTVLLLAGCNQFRGWHGGPTGETKAVRPDAPQPTAEALVNYLNDCSRRLQSIDCSELDLDAKQNMNGGSLRGWMVCSKPRSFRMTAKLVGKDVADMGSNEQEFWWWIGQSDPPYLFHCSYDAMQNNRVRMSLPFQPEWMLEALGMAEYGPAQNYTINVTQNTIELSEQSQTPSGQPVRKVTVFARGVTQGSVPQVTAHILQDAKGGVICAAYITEVTRDPSGAIVPKRVRLECPQDRMELKMTLRSVTINQPIEQQRAVRLFSRPQLAGVAAYDLARAADAPTSQAIRRTSGIEPQR